jgi:hypothetical protein
MSALQYSTIEYLLVVIQSKGIVFFLFTDHKLLNHATHHHAIRHFHPLVFGCGIDPFLARILLFAAEAAQKEVGEEKQRRAITDREL